MKYHFYSKSHKILISPFHSELSSPYNDSPASTNLSPISNNSIDLLPFDQISDEESFQDPEEMFFSQLSPNSKASYILFESKKISKKSTMDHNVQASKKYSGKSGRKRTAWSASEDAELLKLLEIHGKKWAKIAEEMGDRTGKQVRDRYLNVLIGNINKAPFSEEEDQKILEMMEKIGNQWCKIAECLDRRTEMQVKNRYNTVLKKNVCASKSVREESNNEEEEEEDPTNMISYRNLENDGLDFGWKESDLFL